MGRAGLCGAPAGPACGPVAALLADKPSVLTDLLPLLELYLLVKLVRALERL
jgi:hypothetical protein